MVDRQTGRPAGRPGGRPLTRQRSKNVGTVKVFDEKNGLTKNDKNAVLQAKVEKRANAFFYSMTFEEAPLRGAKIRPSGHHFRATRFRAESR